ISRPLKLGAYPSPLPRSAGQSTRRRHAGVQGTRAGIRCPVQPVPREPPSRRNVPTLRARRQRPPHRPRPLAAGPSGAPAPVFSFPTSDALFNCAWSESHECLCDAASEDGSVRLFDAAYPEKETEAAGGGGDVEECASCGGGGEEEGCPVADDEGDGEVFDRAAFSRFLRKASLGETKEYSKMSYLCNIAYILSAKMSAKIQLAVCDFVSAREGQNKS
ncbi:uncharacterized protein LOC133927704, partial [Phragmites australis]|uniref:uncharacterized protein LOC133927704 n=1 Tax=Phragmites australis TaxID=29695 RepID=UPI002D792CB4